MNIRNYDLRSADLKRLEAALSSSPDSKLYIFGCTATELKLMEYLGSHSAVLEKLAGFVVDDARYNKEVFCDKPVYKYSVAEKMFKDGDAVAIGHNHDMAARETIKKLPSCVEAAYFYLPMWYTDEKIFIAYDNDVDKLKAEFEKTYKLLSDEKSKQTMEAFVNCCLNGFSDDLIPLIEKGQYFNPLTENCCVDNFLDCGAFDGDTIEDAVKFYGDRIKKIIAFEPDEANLKALSERMKKCGVDENRLFLECKGSWNEPAVLHFSSDGSASSVSDSGDISIEVDRIDNILKANGLRADFIKMDIEGSEKPALSGAEETIRAYHPTLAVSAYHKPDDLIKIPELIIEIAGENVYDFYLRHYGPSLIELVLYAIPRDKK